jgi:hypothetical protein
MGDWRSGEPRGEGVGPNGPGSEAIQLLVCGSSTIKAADVDVQKAMPAIFWRPLVNAVLHLNIRGSSPTAVDGRAHAQYGLSSKVEAADIDMP